jgi:diphthamide biosynthesis methyltransferase
LKVVPCQEIFGFGQARQIVVGVVESHVAVVNGCRYVAVVSCRTTSEKRLVIIEFLGKLLSCDVGQPRADIVVVSQFQVLFVIGHGDFQSTDVITGIAVSVTAVPPFSR